ncbi:DUF4468 domain-containing protein [Cytophagaceae bacterium ABcell3]|nr:DUF4468 domain-containing protein [Cytophagaceae bacterium ABcell3]
MHLKYIGIFALLLFTGKSLIAQTFPTDPDNQKITYQETVEIEGQDQNEIFEKTRKWLEVYFSNKEKVKEDKEKSEVSRKGSFEVIITYDYRYKHKHTVLFNMSIAQKDGKYRYTLTDFSIYDNKNDEKSAVPLETFYQKQRHQNKTELYKNFNKEMTSLLEALQQAVESGEIKDEDDW